MGRKAIFFDGDGTVTDLVKGVPDSAVEAIRACRENGHLTFLCTGRCRAMVDSGLEAVGFDGIIAGAGTYLEWKGEVLYNKEMTPEEARRTMEILRKKGLVPVMEGKDYMYYDLDEYTDDVDWYAGRITRMLGKRWKPITGNEDCMYVNKISAKAVPGADREGALRELSSSFDAVVHEAKSFAGGTIELMPKGYSKALGIAVACRLYGIEQEDTVAFGDSNNDLEMFRHVHTKVAMGSASPKLLELADYVAPDMFHYGIRDGLKHLELI
ncbi:MAG TPA: Cof-type HAD-IIB family hydrolase [Lachnospiraceae bacterium]|nr:Cof-type HAD-IIB family hydrolase [Lachnospiraceae bacterium]